MRRYCLRIHPIGWIFIVLLLALAGEGFREHDRLMIVGFSATAVAVIAVGWIAARG